MLIEGKIILSVKVDKSSKFNESCTSLNKKYLNSKHSKFWISDPGIWYSYQTSSQSKLCPMPTQFGTLRFLPSISHCIHFKFWKSAGSCSWFQPRRSTGVSSFNFHCAQRRWNAYNIFCCFKYVSSRIEYLSCLEQFSASGCSMFASPSQHLPQRL